MNHSNPTGNTFTPSNQQTAETNPFTADLKGEFTSNFGTNTNAVSQIFKDAGPFSSGNRKWIIIGVVVIAFLAVGGYFLLKTEDPMSGDFGSDEVAEKEKPATPEDAKPAEPAKTAEQAAAEAQAAETAAQAQKAAASGPISLVMPAEADERDYDETSGPAAFKWEGAGGGYIVFARNKEMKPEIMRVPVSGNSYNFHHPYPGTWYWKVENSAGSSEIRHFTVRPPARRNITLKEPATNGTLAGNGGVVSWTGDKKVAFYRVEFSNNGNWTNPVFRFATSGEKLPVQGVTPGTYQMRVGAFSEVAGRWEYTTPVNVTVQ